MGKIHRNICTCGKLVHHSSSPNTKLLNKWHTQQVDYVLDYPQALIEYDQLMKLTMSLRIKGLNQKTHFLKLLKNIYVQKQGGRLWNQYIVQRILDISFKQSYIDKCVFYRGDTI